MDPLDPRLCSFKEHAIQSMTQVYADWEMMTGATLSPKAASATVVDRPKYLGAGLVKACVLARTQVLGRCEGPLLFLFPTTIAARIVGHLVMLPPEVIDEKEDDELSDSDVEAFQEMVNLMCGSTNNVYQERWKDLRVSQDVAHLQVELHTPGDASTFRELPDGPMALVRIAVEMDGKSFPTALALPLDLALEIGELYKTAAA